MDPLVVETQRIGARIAREWFDRPHPTAQLPMSEAVLAAMLSGAAAEGAAIATRDYTSRLIAETKSSEAVRS